MAFHFQFVMIWKTPQLWVVPFPNGKVYLLYVKPFAKGWLQFLGDCGRETQLLIVYFDRELMKGSGSGSWDSCCVSVENVFSFCFICISLCFTIHSYSFPVKFSKYDKVEFMFIALPVGKFHVLCSSSVEKDSCVYALFTLLNNLSISHYFKFNC